MSVFVLNYITQLKKILSGVKTNRTKLVLKKSEIKFVMVSRVIQMLWVSVYRITFQLKCHLKALNGCNYMKYSLSILKNHLITTSNLHTPLIRITKQVYYFAQSVIFIKIRPCKSNE